MKTSRLEIGKLYRVFPHERAADETSQADVTIAWPKPMRSYASDDYWIVNLSTPFLMLEIRDVPTVIGGYVSTDFVPKTVEKLESYYRIICEETIGWILAERCDSLKGLREIKEDADDV